MLSDEAREGMQALIDSLRPLAKVGLDSWHASVRVWLEMYRPNGPGALSTQQIAVVIGKAPPLVDGENPDLHMFIKTLLEVP